MINPFSSVFFILGAFALGAVSAYAMAPYYFWPLLFIGLSGLYVLLHHAKTARMAGVYGFVFGLGYFGFGLSWIGNALLIDGNSYRWVWPLAVAGLPVILSPFPALACGFFKRFCCTDNIRGYLAFTGFLALSELLRGHLFTGFPWNLYGYAWADMLPIVQITSHGTIYFLTALTIFWAALPGCLLISTHRNTIRFFIATVGIGLFAGLYVWGDARLQAHPTQYHENINLAIVQPNIAQSKKWDPQYMGDNFLQTVALSRHQDGNDQPRTTYIIWPETTVSQHYLNSPRIIEMIRNMLGSYNGKAYLITGALLQDSNDGSYTNSLIMIDSTGKITNVYNKSHLVPFGEYIPLDSIFNISPVVGFSGFVQGGGPTTFKTPEGIRYAPLICYEVIFPGAVIRKNADVPDVIINVTNDGWYGISAGPHQHFVQSLYRAIEEGVPVARSANTGFSGLIDPFGRVISQSNLFEEKVQNIKMPKKFAQTPKNIYSAKVIIFALFICLILLGLKKFSGNTNDN